MPFNLKKNPTEIIIAALGLALFAGCMVPIRNKNTGGEITVSGRITSYHKENTLKGAYIYVYKDNSTDFKDDPFFISGPADDNGRFSFKIPAGKYFLVARRFLDKAPKTSNLKMQVGEYFGYYGGNPIAIFNDPFLININCGRVTRELEVEPAPAVSGNKEDSGIKGTVFFDDRPLPEAYVFLYNNSSTNFKGSHYSAYSTTDAEGRFKIDISPGSYYVITKKKKTANPVPTSTASVFDQGWDPVGNIVGGPLSHNDYYFYYYNNPVNVPEGNYINITIPAINKLGEDKITHYDYITPTRVEGTVRDADGKPVKGMRVFAFRRLLLGVEKPAFISTVTKEDGKYVINFSEDGLFYLIARDAIGRPIRRGDTYGYYFGTGDHSIMVKMNTVLTNIDLEVWKLE